MICKGKVDGAPLYLNPVAVTSLRWNKDEEVTVTSWSIKGDLVRVPEGPEQIFENGASNRVDDGLAGKLLLLNHGTANIQ